MAPADSCTPHSIVCTFDLAGRADSCRLLEGTERRARDLIRHPTAFSTDDHSLALVQATQGDRVSVKWKHVVALWCAFFALSVTALSFVERQRGWLSNADVRRRPHVLCSLLWLLTRAAIIEAERKHHASLDSSTKPKRIPLRRPRANVCGGKTISHQPHHV